jgi:hypothetical protein
MVNARGDYLVQTLDELLPCVFDRERLLAGTVETVDP